VHRELIRVYKIEEGIIEIYVSVQVKKRIDLNNIKILNILFLILDI
jgi:hypothetical protein